MNTLGEDLSSKNEKHPGLEVRAHEWESPAPGTATRVGPQNRINIALPAVITNQSEC